MVKEETEYEYMVTKILENAGQGNYRIQ